MTEAVEVQQLASPQELVGCSHAILPSLAHAIHEHKCKSRRARWATLCGLFRHLRADMTELLRERRGMQAINGAVAITAAARHASDARFFRAVKGESSPSAIGFPHECGNGQGKPCDAARNARFHAAFSILHTAWCDCGEGGKRLRRSWLAPPPSHPLSRDESDALAFVVEVVA